MAGKRATYQDGRRGRKSAFAININTNKPVLALEKRGELWSFIETFRQALRKVFAERGILQSTGKHKDDNLGADWDRLIQQLTVDGAIEIVGDKQERVHAHLLIEVRHRSSVQMATSYISTRLRDELGFAIHVQRSHSATSFTTDQLEYPFKFVHTRKLLIWPERHARAPKQPEPQEPAERPVKKPQDQIQCEACGTSVRRDAIARHRKSKTHIANQKLLDSKK